MVYKLWKMSLTTEKGALREFLLKNAALLTSFEGFLSITFTFQRCHYKLGTEYT